MADRPDEDTLDERKSAILRAVVNEHIETGQPVGSAHVSEAAKLTVSSATVRNEMSALERDGYLTHPHTSAGRVPTDRGYRYYVDSIDPRTASMGQPVAAQVNEFFDRAHGELGRLLDHTTRLLSDLTDHTAVVMSPEQESAIVRNVQVVALGPSHRRDGQPCEQALVVVVLNNGTVDKETLELEVGVSAAHIGAATAHLTTALVGHPRRSLPGSISATGEPLVDKVCSAAMGALSITGIEPTTPLLVGGAARVANSFDALQTVRNILSVLEEQYLVVNLLRDTVRSGPNVSIGGEHGVDALYQPLASCSLVVAPYLIDGKVAGSVGVLGPTRMNYPQVLATVVAVSSKLSDRLSERSPE
jgi:heat-inducible transcriptional repressor